MAIYQDLVTDHGFAARYNSVRLFTIKLRGQKVPEPHPTIVTEPGQEGQVDYGEGPMVRDAATGSTDGRVFSCSRSATVGSPYGC
jgi:hypothetical protein